MESTAVPLERFGAYVAEKVTPITCQAGMKALAQQRAYPLYRTPNPDANRYADIIPYEHSRVKLSDSGTKPGEDLGYFNANHIASLSELDQVQYIAASAPTVVALDCFWRMVWEKDVTIIIMLTRESENGKVKADKYWGSPGKTHTRAKRRITLFSEETNDSFIERKFTIVDGEAEREVTQLQFLLWPDYGAPTEMESLASLLTHYRDLRACPPQTSLNGPVLVHCSAGVGRTGTFIAVDMLLDNLPQADRPLLPAHLRSLDLFKTISHLRTSRMLLVQSSEQLRFLHLFLAFALRTQLGGVLARIPPTQADIDELRASETGLRERLARSEDERDVLTKLVERLKERYIEAKVENALLAKQLDAATQST